MSDLADKIAGLSPAKRALLELLAARQRPAPAAAIPRRPDPASAPLSFAQERVWFLEQLEPGTMVYHLPLAVQVAGPLDPAWIARGLGVLVQRHEALRTTVDVVEGRPVQRVAATVAVPCEIVDLSSQDDASRQASLAHVSRLTFEPPFDLRQGPLWRVTVVRLQPDAHVVLLAMHHLIADGWSLDVIVEEMFVCCAAYATGVEPTLPPVPVSFGDYAAWQRATFDGEALQQQRDYWLKTLAGVPVLELPTDAPRPPALTYRGRTITFTLGEPLSRALHDVSRRHDVTVFVTLLAAYVLFLSRYSGQDDIAVGTPVANRGRVETERAVGFFANTLVLRVGVDGRETFASLLRRVREVVLNAHDRQDVPFEHLVEALQPRRDPARNPLFQAMLTLQKPSRLGSGGAVAASMLPIDATAAKFDLTLTLQELATDFTASLEYSTDLFEETTARRMVDHFTTLLGSALRTPDAPVATLPLMRAEERAQVVDGWNRTAVTWPVLAPLPALIEAQVARTPGAAAVVFEGESLTYAEVNARANQLARHLRACGVGADDAVGVCLERSADLVIALLAVQKAGAAYLPLDPTYPADRLAFMLGDARVRVVIGEAASPVGAEVARGLAFVDLTASREALAAQPSTNLDTRIDLDGAAYVIYTSGSTGLPKGVVNTHRGIANRLLWMQAEYGIDGSDRVIQKTPFTFDVSVWEFFWPLMTGAAIVVARPEGHKDPVYLARLIVEAGVTTAHFVPSMLELFLDEPASSHCRGLTRIICSGEALGVELQERCRLRLPAALHNLYGPTEAAVDVTYWPCDRTGRRRFVPIGHPIANTRMFVVDDRFEPVPIGVPGELIIAGVGLSRGYLQRPDVTADRFIPDPFSVEPGARMYRTGDVARFGADGAIEFLGRRDHQVKLRGFRIELGEIEAALQRSEGVQRAVVVLRDLAGASALVAYLVPTAGTRLDPAVLREGLRRDLPDYMVPSAFVSLDALPLTTSGKLDRARLPEPAVTTSAATRVPPRDALEARLIDIWREALRCGEIGIEDSFFDLGGHSMLAARVLAVVREALGVEVPLRALFEAPTIAALADVIRRQQAGDAGEGVAATPLDLERDVRLAPDVWPPMRAETRLGPRRVLLTGATGFLGAFLLRDLLERTTDDVVCLVRADDEAAGLARIRKGLASYGIWRDDYARRLGVVCGNLSEPRLGLTQGAFDTLAGTVDAIVHNGALVNFLQPYRALVASNVKGTEEVLRLACRRVLKPVHYVSTVDVLGRAALSAGEDDPLVHADGLETGYAQSKWVAERIVALARARGVPVAIYRPARIIGDSRSGAWNTDDFAARVVKGCIQAGFAPADPPWDNLSPVDFVSAAIVELSRDEAATATRAFHVVNPRWFFWSRMIAYVRERGYPIEVVPYAEWHRALTVDAARQENALATLLPLFPAPPAGAPAAVAAATVAPQDPPAPRCERAQAVLARRGLACPEVDAALLDRYFDYFVRAGFLAPPPGRPSLALASPS